MGYESRELVAKREKSARSRRVKDFTKYGDGACSVIFDSGECYSKLVIPKIVCPLSNEKSTFV